jgi:chemotaxis protein methyltransferase CheR
MITISAKEFYRISDYVKRHYGIHLKEAKMTLVMGRLQQLLHQKGYSSFSEYFDYIVSDKSGAAVAQMIDKITTNHTFFMREPEHFTYLRDRVLPHLAQTLRDKDLRIWSAGCSTGQEPYTLAMILRDFFGSSQDGWDTKVLATDLSSQVLDKAIAGVYPDDQVSALPKLWKSTYFRSISRGEWVVDERIRKEVIFRRFNLMDPVFPFRKKFHVIFCRNVMIYFDNPTKEALINKFWEITEPGGYLFVGHSESLNRDKTAYRYVMPAVYRKE